LEHNGSGTPLKREKRDDTNEKNLENIKKSLLLVILHWCKKEYVVEKRLGRRWHS
jgi:hypothetical protein